MNAACAFILKREKRKLYENSSALKAAKRTLEFS
jgi:hypothetical protein